MSSNACLIQACYLLGLGNANDRKTIFSSHRNQEEDSNYPLGQCQLWSFGRHLHWNMQIRREAQDANVVERAATDPLERSRTSKISVWGFLWHRRACSNDVVRACEVHQTLFAPFLHTDLHVLCDVTWSFWRFRPDPARGIGRNKDQESSRTGLSSVVVAIVISMKLSHDAANGIIVQSRSMKALSLCRYSKELLVQCLDRLSALIISNNERNVCFAGAL